jgi:hypothetical protein
MTTLESKLNPADPIYNPPAVAEIAPPDLPVAMLDGRPALEPDALPLLAQTDHPLGPHNVIELVRGTAAGRRSSGIRTSLL